MRRGGRRRSSLPAACSGPGALPPAGGLVAVLLVAVLALAACGGESDQGVVLTFPGSAVGAEARVLRTQLDRFMAAHPGIRVEQRVTPDAADQRHQLYVQWLNARAPEPDILQLDVIWTPEFAAAGWILPLDSLGADAAPFFPNTVRANRWRGHVFALPWFVDMGLLYWRTDLVDGPPATFAQLARVAERAQREDSVRYGFVWQGARYEGLVTVFLEHLGGFGGRIMDDSGHITVDSDAAVRALTYMRDAVWKEGFVPQAALTWQEEQTRFAFQNGEAAFMRNWPYAYPLMEDTAGSSVAGRFAAATMPAGPEGEPTSALGGSQLAINAHTRHPRAALELLRFLTAPRQMIERARVVGEYPTRRALYAGDTLRGLLPIPPARARELIEHAVPRPVTPVYSQLSSLLQIQLHRALTRQADPRQALETAARQMRGLLARVGLMPGGSSGAARGDTADPAEGNRG
ncbi:MAG TPA: ABC transporter substrate-binding protein [Gemmatimonadota bacterium]|nr:ABC transporter substrate-binding protein [Gemmatimonadota bacterium]